MNFSVHLSKSRMGMVGLTLAPEGSGSLVKPQPVYMLLQLRSCFHWGYRMSENNKWKKPLHFVRKRWTQSSLVPRELFVICRTVWQVRKSWVVTCERDSMHSSCTYIVSNVSGSVCKYQHRPKNDTTVSVYTSTTWMAWLTQASEGSGSLPKLQPIHACNHLWSHSHWGCKMSLAAM